jgi:hypothetical protein
MNGAAIGIARIFIKVYGADQTFVIWQWKIVWIGFAAFHTI